MLALTGSITEVPSQTLQQMLKDLGEAWCRFFENPKKGHQPAPDNPALRRTLKKAGVKLAYPPRFKKRGEKDGMRFPQGFEIDDANARIKLHKMDGWIRYRKSRALIGTPKNVTIILDASGWHLSIQTEREDHIDSDATKIGAADRGVTDFIAIAESDPDRIEGHAVGTVPPINALKKVAHTLNRYQRAAARKMEAAKVKAGIPKGAPFPKGFKLKKSNRLKHALGKVASLQAKVARVRLDWLHKLSTNLADDYSALCLEDLKIANMTASAKGTENAPCRQVSQKAELNKSVMDQGWGQFATLLAYKMAWRGGQIVWVPSHYTSQKCSHCGHPHPDNRDRKSFKCLVCGFASDADLNAALNILAAGHVVLADGSNAPCFADVEDTVLSAGLRSVNLINSKEAHHAPYKSHASRIENHQTSVR
jgi:putative transposase